jgi:hypothetical protein
MNSMLAVFKDYPSARTHVAMWLTTSLQSE